MYEALKQYFSGASILDCSCFVADYTESTKDAPVKKGVEISTQPFSDIDYFSLIKDNNQPIPYLAINNEHYTEFIDAKDNCECMFHSLSEGRKPWSLYLETKYCKEENIDNHSLKAYKQMKSMMDTLDSNGLLDHRTRSNYFVYSVPEHEMQQPFRSWQMTQSETIERLEDDGIILYGNNSVLIATARHLLIPKRKI